MFFLRTQIQRDEQVGCAPLLTRTSPIQTAELQASNNRILARALTLTGTAAREQKDPCSTQARERGLCQESIGES
ncbi:MAG: hypothetical protein NTNFB01_09280 [Nitrospira sp.]|jgi:hypothetical protein